MKYNVWEESRAYLIVIKKIRERENERNDEGMFLSRNENTIVELYEVLNFYDTQDRRVQNRIRDSRRVVGKVYMILSVLLRWKSSITSRCIVRIIFTFFTID